MQFSFLFHEPIPTLAELDRRMGILASLGYKGVELSAFHPISYTAEEIAGVTRTRGVPVVSFLTGWSYANERLCLSSPDSLVRGRTVCRLNDYVGDAARLNALLVVGLLQGLRSDEPDLAIANARIVEGLRRVARTAQDRGISIVLEPVNHLQVGFNHNAADVAAAGQADRLTGDELHARHVSPEYRGALHPRSDPRAWTPHSPRSSL